jgi:hypothetical protein
VFWPVALAWLRRWQWLIAAVVAGMPILYYGPRKLLETWDWYINRFIDEPVLDILLERRFVQEVNRSLREEPYSVGELATALHRSHPSVSKSIQRLKRRGKIELYRGGFRVKE